METKSVVAGATGSAVLVGVVWALFAFYDSRTAGRFEILDLKVDAIARDVAFLAGRQAERDQRTVP